MSAAVVSAAMRQALAKVEDCNECKFCKDKPKNGGANTMRQRCISKQELLRQMMASESQRDAARCSETRQMTASERAALTTARARVAGSRGNSGAATPE